MIMDYKKVEVKEINGIKVTSRTLSLTEDEEQEKFSEIRLMLNRIALNHSNDKTA